MTEQKERVRVSKDWTPEERVQLAELIKTEIIANDTKEAAERANSSAPFIRQPGANFETYEYTRRYLQHLIDMLLDCTAEDLETNRWRFNEYLESPDQNPANELDANELEAFEALRRRVLEGPDTPGVL